MELILMILGIVDPHQQDFPGISLQSPGILPVFDLLYDRPRGLVIF